MVRQQKSVRRLRSTPKTRIAMPTTDSTISGSAIVQFIVRAPRAEPAATVWLAHRQWPAVCCFTIAATVASQKLVKLLG